MHPNGEDERSQGNAGVQVLVPHGLHLAAQLRSIAFVDCTIDELNVAGATLSKVDLSGARLRSIVGVESLRGAIVSHEQLLDLAPLLAAQLGLEVRSDRPDDDAGRPAP